MPQLAANRRTTKALLAVGAALLLAAMVALGLQLVNGSSSGTLAAGTATPSAPAAPAPPESQSPDQQPEDGASAEQSGDASQPRPEPGPTDLPYPVAAEVVVGEVADDGSGVTAVVNDLSVVETDAQGIGAVAGRALVVRVSVTNGTSQPIPGSLVGVSSFFGEQAIPGTQQATDSRGSPFPEEIPAGGSAEASYVFSIPPNAGGTVRLVVIPSAGAAATVFTGEIPS